jgi:hypothetical protein
MRNFPLEPCDSFVIGGREGHFWGFFEDVVHLETMSFNELARNLSISRFGWLNKKKLLGALYGE